MSLDDAGHPLGDAGRPLGDAGTTPDDAASPSDAGPERALAFEALEPPGPGVVVADVAEDGTVFAATASEVFVRTSGGWTSVAAGIDPPIVDLAALDAQTVVVASSPPAIMRLVREGSVETLASWDNCVWPFRVAHDGSGTIVATCAYYAGVARAVVGSGAGPEIADTAEAFVTREAIVRRPDDVVTLGASGTLRRFTGGDWTDPTAWESIGETASTVSFPAMASRAPGEYVIVAQGGFAARLRDGAIALEDTGVDVDLVSAAWVADVGELAAGGSGTLLRHDGAGWAPVAIPTEDDLAHVRANAGGDVVVTTAAGALFTRAS